MSSNATSNHSQARGAMLVYEAGAQSEGDAARGVVLSRALCRFLPFRASGGVKRGHRARAARIFAETHAPFAHSGMLVLENSSGASIWYWDNAQLAELGVPAARSISPESVWRPAGDGWRILACLEGFEAQYWADGALMASNWRRKPHTPEQWRGFALSVDNAAHEAPEAPPPATLSDLTETSWRRAVVRKPLGWREVETCAWSVSLCLAAVLVFLVGQSLRYTHEANQSERQAAVIEARSAANQEAMRTRGFLQLMEAFRVATSGGGALEAMTEAFATLSTFGVEATQWSFDSSRFSVLIGAPNETPVRDIVRAMEQSRALCDVTPEIDVDGVRIEGGVERGGDCSAEDRESGE